MSTSTQQFAEEYPAPWSLEGDHVVDAGGDEVVMLADDDAHERMFWQGIIDAVNANARLECALRLARAL